MADAAWRSYPSVAAGGSAAFACREGTRIATGPASRHTRAIVHRVRTAFVIDVNRHVRSSRPRPSVPRQKTR